MKFLRQIYIRCKNSLKISFNAQTDYSALNIAKLCELIVACVHGNFIQGKTNIFLNLTLISPYSIHRDTERRMQVGPNVAPARKLESSTFNNLFPVPPN